MPQSRTVRAGHRVSVRGTPLATNKWTQDAYVALAAGESVTITAEPVTPPPPPTTPGVYGVYGTAIALDGKDNRWIGGTVPGREVAHRWWTKGGPMVEYGYNQRYGPGYSMGDGGLIELALFRCGADGLPTGSPLSTKVFAANHGPTTAEVKTMMPWVTDLGPPGLVCVTHRNVHADPVNNWSCANEAWHPRPDSPRQPAFPDDSLAVLWKNQNGASGWSLVPQNTPVFAVKKADGTWEGQAYYERMGGQEVIVSGTTKVRERFTPKQALNIKGVWLRVQRKAGTGLLTAQFAGQAGTAAIGHIPIETVISGVFVGGIWTFVPLIASVPANVEQTVVYSVPSGTEIRATPIRESESGPVWGSRAFTDGVAEKSIAGGAWQAMYYDGVADLQFFLETA